MNDKLAIYLNDDIAHLSNKMGVSVLHFSPDKVTCIVNKNHVGGNIKEFYPFLTEKPIVADLKAAQQRGANTLLMGLALQGGLVTPNLLLEMKKAIEMNLRVLHGFHDSVELLALEKKANGLIKNLRHPDEKYLVKTQDKVRKLNNARVLMVGTDMAVGKMTAALLLNQAAKARNIASEFIATGQVGIAISGKGVPLDAIKLDFTGGAIEALVLENEAPLMFIEGQGAIINPGSSATLPLIRGCVPTHLVLCHNASLSTLKDYKHIPIPEFIGLMHLYENIAEACGSFPRPQTVGICVNTSGLAPQAATDYLQKLEREAGKLVLDPVSEPAKLDQIIDLIVN